MNNYLLAGFKREMDSLPIEYTITQDKDKYILEYKNLPTELDFLLIKAEYEQSMIIEEEKTMFGNIKKYDYSYQKVCKPIISNQDRIIQVDLSDNYYTTKLNKISSIIRNYFHTAH